MQLISLAVNLRHAQTLAFQSQLGSLEQLQLAFWPLPLPVENFRLNTTPRAIVSR